MIWMADKIVFKYFMQSSVTQTCTQDSDVHKTRDSKTPALRLQNPLLSSPALPVFVKMLNTEDECGEQIKPEPGLILSLQSRCSLFLQVFTVNQFSANLRRAREERGLIRDNQVPPWEAQATAWRGPRDGFWCELWRAGRCQVLREVKYWLFPGKYHLARHLEGLIPPDVLESLSYRLSCSFGTGLWYPKNTPRGFQMSLSTGRVYQPVGTGPLQRCTCVITQTRLSKNPVSCNPSLLFDFRSMLSIFPSVIYSFQILTHQLLWLIGLKHISLITSYIL